MFHKPLTDAEIKLQLLNSLAAIKMRNEDAAKSALAVLAGRTGDVLSREQINAVLAIPEIVKYPQVADYVSSYPVVDDAMDVAVDFDEHALYQLLLSTNWDRYGIDSLGTYLELFVTKVKNGLDTIEKTIDLVKLACNEVNAEHKTQSEIDHLMDLEDVLNGTFDRHSQSSNKKSYFGFC